MNYIGDFDVGAVVKIYFNTFSSNDPSASVTMTNFINTDVHIFKDDSLTQRTNAAGITVDVDVDTYAGVHKITIDTANNTVGDFFEAGHDYAVIIEGVTVDAATLNPVVGTFSIANRRVAGQMCVSSIATLASQTSFTLTAGEASANNDAYNGCTILVTDQVTKIQKAIGHISDYTGSSRTIALHAAPLQTAFTMAVGDSVEIIATSVFANVNTVGQTLQTANDNGADINTLIAVIGALNDAAAAGEVTSADTLMQYIKQLINILIGAAGIGTFPAEAAPGDAVSLAEVIRAIHADVTGLNGSAMIGTNGANTTVPDAAGIAATPAEVATALTTYDAPTEAEMNTAHALLATVAKQDVIDGIVDAILLDTGTDGVILKAAGLNADAVDKIIDEVIEGSITLRQLLRIVLAALAGKTTGGGTTTVNFRNIADNLNRIIATVDADGNRSAITLDGT